MSVKTCFMTRLIKPLLGLMNNGHGTIYDRIGYPIYIIGISGLCSFRCYNRNAIAGYLWFILFAAYYTK